MTQRNVTSFFFAAREPQPRRICVSLGRPFRFHVNWICRSAKWPKGWPVGLPTEEKPRIQRNLIGCRSRKAEELFPPQILWLKNLIMFKFQRVFFGCETWDLYPMFHWLRKCVAIRGTSTLVALFHRQWWFVGSENMCPKDEEFPSWKLISTPKALDIWTSRTWFFPEGFDVFFSAMGMFWKDVCQMVRNMEIWESFLGCVAFFVKITPKLKQIEEWYF